MTQAVENTDSYYIANGATTTFGFTFSADLSSEVIVLANGITATGYTFSSSFPITGGANVVFTVAPTNGTTISILRKTQLSQEANFDSTTAFLEAEHEKALDKMVRGQQDLARDVREKSVRLADSSEGFPNGFIIPKPIAGDVGKLVILNNNVPPDGFAFSGADIGSIDTNVATAVAAATTATTQAGIATGAASTASAASTSANASAGIATAAAGSASAIAAGSLYTGVIHSGATLTPVDNAGPYIIQAACEILLPAPTPNFNFSIEVVGNQTITLTRNNVANTIKVQDQTITDDVQFTDYGFYGITCLETGVWLLTKTESTNLYIQAPTGPTGPAGPTGPTGPTGPAGGALADGDYGDITVSGAGSVFTLDNTAISSKTSATPVSGDSIVFSDVSDSNNLKKCLLSELPAPTTDTTTYKMTADQGSITTVITSMTGLRFTPIANTTYRVSASIAWSNTSTGNAIAAGVPTGNMSGVSWLRGIMTSSTSSTSMANQAINTTVPNAAFSGAGSNANGNFLQIDLMFRSNGSPTDFDLGISNNGSGTITVFAGSSMTVQKVT